MTADKSAAPVGSVPAPRASGEPVARGRLFGYALGSVGTGIFGAVPGLLLLYYLTDSLGVPAAVAGVVLVLPKAWDVLLNPWVGALSDREAVRTGSRQRLLLLGALTLPVLFALMFASPFTGGAGAAWAMAAFLLAASAFAAFQVPYVALPAEISDVPAQRSRAMAWRIVALTFGILLAGGLAPVLVGAGGDGRGGYLLMGVVVGALLAAALIGSSLSTRWIRSAPGPQQLGFRAALRLARGNRPFFALLGAFTVQSLAVAVMLAGAPYVAQYRLGDDGLTTVLFVCMVGLSAVAVPVWSLLGRRFGPVPCYLAAVALFTAAALGLYPALSAGAKLPAFALTALVGAGYAALQLFPLSLLPETVHADAGRTGQAQSGAFTGVWTAAETGAMALGSGVYALVLAVTGFVSSSDDETVAQTGTALGGLTAGFTLVPALLLALSAPLLVLYARRAAAHKNVKDAAA
ncbi:MFS transporter [Actinocorallia sp. A-T 12471]|uniref:MFS transporter n=1 Tax=Actinocorallia sp. A-T 12471 TaxID=3089813 RepID=UPI0029D024FF|nr:MFS transporter [Actinocorallia sp. A-T 12471]MDX6741276.1 MFS transporter [Actinocorallia sp. A-T 12471]